MQDRELAAIAGDLNATPAAADAAPKHARLVNDMNRIVREAADALVDLDSTSASFEAFKTTDDRPA